MVLVRCFISVASTRHVARTRTQVEPQVQRRENASLAFNSPTVRRKDDVQTCWTCSVCENVIWLHKITRKNSVAVHQNRQEVVFFILETVISLYVFLCLCLFLTVLMGMGVFVVRLELFSSAGGVYKRCIDTHCCLSREPNTTT